MSLSTPSSLLTRFSRQAARLATSAQPHASRAIRPAVVSERLSSSVTTVSRSGTTTSAPLWSHCQSQTRPQSSAAALDFNDDDFDDGNAAMGVPVGDLFDAFKTLSDGDSQQLLGATASVRRTFGPGSNAKALLTCGGDELARSASFDPVYSRAQGWVRQHAVGPAVLSPVLLSGLVGALVEAALPHSVHMSSSTEQIRPLIVGVEVCARIVVDAVGESESPSTNSDLALLQNHRPGRTNGFPLRLRTEVVRVQDNAVISQGTHDVWMPDYMHM